MADKVGAVCLGDPWARHGDRPLRHCVRRVGPDLRDGKTLLASAASAASRSRISSSWSPFWGRSSLRKQHIVVGECVNVT
jgi:hypothetical protein